MKIIGVVLVTLFTAAIMASAKAIVDVAVLQKENENVHALLINAREDRKVIHKDIKDILTILGRH